MSENVIKVDGDLKHTLHPGTLITLGLDHVLGLHYMIKTKIIGLAHIMLPGHTKRETGSIRQNLQIPE